MQKIAAAFVKAQQGFEPARKTANNPHFRSKYADLATCVEAVISSLNENGIGLMQTCHPSDTGVIVETVFLHESGERIDCGQLHVPASKHDAQGYGSALTYARRYSLLAACGIAPEDDDGNAAAASSPDVAAIVAGIRNASSVDVLRANYEAALLMLPKAHHDKINTAKNDRYRELVPASKKPNAA